MLTILVTIAIVGLIAWALTYFIPMPEKFKTAIYVVAGIGLLLYLLQFLGVGHGLPRMLR